MSNRLIIAAAGSGKTTYLINSALEIKEQKVLLTTFTEANEREIRKKFIEIHGSVPHNVTVQTWFSFLIEHGVKPYQSFLFDGKVTGLELVNQKSGLRSVGKQGPIYWGEDNVQYHYFNSTGQIYSDKLSKFVYRVNEYSGGLIIDRLSRIYPNIFIDEIQDLAGYDLSLIKLFMQSNSNLTMVGDPRQVTYHTHEESKFKKYSEGQVEQFIQNECKGIQIDIDKKSLCISHRNKKDICQFANQLYPDIDPCGYQEQEPSDHEGVFLVHEDDIDDYLKRFSPIQLRDKVTVKVNRSYAAMNFGNAKGLTFNHVLIYPTKPMIEWIEDHSKPLKPESRSKFYVAITRARYSVGIVVNKNLKIKIQGIQGISVYKRVGDIKS